MQKSIMKMHRFLWPIIRKQKNKRKFSTLCVWIAVVTVHTGKGLNAVIWQLFTYQKVEILDSCETLYYAHFWALCLLVSRPDCVKKKKKEKKSPAKPKQPPAKNQPKNPQPTSCEITLCFCIYIVALGAAELMHFKCLSICFKKLVLFMWFGLCGFCLLWGVLRT